MPFRGHNLISEEDMSRYLIQPVKPEKKKGDGESSSSSSERRRRNKSTMEAGAAYGSDDQVQDSYSLFTKDLDHPLRSRNRSVKHYTDDKSLLDDAVVTPSFDQHMDKYNLGNYDEETA